MDFYSLVKEELPKVLGVATLCGGRYALGNASALESNFAVFIATFAES